MSLFLVGLMSDLPYETYVCSSTVVIRGAVRYGHELPARVLDTMSINEQVSAHCLDHRARFGPNGIRQGARRLGVDRINVHMKTRVSEFLNVVDCGDVRTFILP